MGVYTGEFFLRCFLLFLCGFLELGVLLMGDFCLFLGAKTGSMGVYGHNFTISRPTGWDCTEVSQPREHWDIGVFFLYTLQEEHESVRAFLSIGLFLLFWNQDIPFLLQSCLLWSLTVMPRFRLEFPPIQNSTVSSTLLSLTTTCIEPSSYALPPEPTDRSPVDCPR